MALSNPPEINLLSIRPPQTNIILTGYSGFEDGINGSPIRASVPSLSLFYVPTVVQRDLEYLGYKVTTKHIDLASENPSKLSPYIYPYSEDETISYGLGIVRKYLRGEELSSLETRLEEIDVCLISSPMVTDSTAVAQTIQTIKRINPNIIVLVGGRDVQDRAEWYLERGADAAVLGCAEHLAARAIDALISHKSIDFNGVLIRGKERPPESGIDKISRDSLLEEEVLPDFDPEIILRYTKSCEGLSPEGVKAPYMWFRTSVGCFNNCNFCPSANSEIRCLSLEQVDRLLQHYRDSGIQSLLNCDDNFLARLKVGARSDTENEREIITIMRLIRQHGFAHEFANGLQIKLLLNQKKHVREQLVEELFTHNIHAGSFVGTYRMYWPHETLINRGEYAKLPTDADNYNVLDVVLQTRIPEIVFNTILFSHYTKKDLLLLDQKTEEFCNWMKIHNRGTKWSLAFFHELPLPGSRRYASLIKRSFDINKHPELWAVSFNPTDGEHFSYDELYDIKMKMMQKYDPITLVSWANKGEYAYH